MLIRTFINLATRLNWVTKKINMKNKVVKLFGDNHNGQNGKYAALLNDFIKHFEHNFPDDFELEDIIYFGMNAWNFGNMSLILSKEEFKKILLEASSQGSEIDLIKKMVDRKIAKFKEHDLFIADFELKEVDGVAVITVKTEQETEFLENLMEDMRLPAEKTDFEEGYINRHAIVVKPQKPYFDWIASIDDLFMTYEESEVNIYLVTEEIDDLGQWLKRNYAKFFALELENEITDKKRWPKKRTYKMFQQWFTVEFSTMIYDLENNPVYKED